MKIAVTRRLFQSEIDRLRERFEVAEWDSDLPPDPDQLRELLSDAVGALTLLTDRIDDDVLAAHPSLRVISNLAVGYDNIDVPAATSRGVAVCTTPDVLTETTAEFALALIFDAARQVSAGDRSARAGEWETWYPMRFLGRGVAGTTLGIVGFGRIGRNLAEMASALGMRVVVSDPAGDSAAYENLPLAELLQTSDVVSIHTPLTPSTRQLLDAERIGMMKDDAVLINTARGPVIDTTALVAALEAGKLRAVGLDVTDPEPLPQTHPLYAFERVTITPHIASATVATRTEMARLAVDNIIAVLEGTEPPHCLNPEVLERD